MAGGNDRGGLSRLTEPQRDCWTELVDGAHGEPAPGFIRNNSFSFIQRRVPYFSNIRVHEVAFIRMCFHSQGRMGDNFLKKKKSVHCVLSKKASQKTCTIKFQICVKTDVCACARVRVCV